MAEPAPLLTLHCHPATPCASIHSLQASAALTPEGDLRLQYILAGELAEISIPPPQAPTFTDGLWEHTCFEAFIGVQGEHGYHEFNVSPSGQWAAYAFSGYRESRKSSPSPAQPLQRGASPFFTGGALRVESSFPLCKRGIEGDFLLETLTPANSLPINTNNAPFQLNLTAVIKTITGKKSYWALKHPAERPDFHHRDGFIHEIWP